MGEIDNWFHHFLNFLAVILGVYLAFYINDSAQKATEEKEAELMLGYIAKEVSSDIGTYGEYQIPFNENHMMQIDSIITSLGQSDLDELNRLLPYLFQVNNYSPTSTSYNSLKSSGKISLIRNLELQQTLGEYYDALAIECMEVNEIQVDYFVDEILDWLTENADLSSMTINADAPLKVFQNKVIIYQSLIEQKVKNYKEIEEFAQEIQELLPAN